MDLPKKTFRCSAFLTQTSFFSLTSSRFPNKSGQNLAEVRSFPCRPRSKIFSPLVVVAVLCSYTKNNQESSVASSSVNTGPSESIKQKDARLCRLSSYNMLIGMMSVGSGLQVWCQLMNGDLENITREAYGTSPTLSSLYTMCFPEDSNAFGLEYIL